MNNLSIRKSDPVDILKICDNPSYEAKIDMKVFMSDKGLLLNECIAAKEHSWTLVDNDEPKCVFWYAAPEDVGFTSMYYTRDFLGYDGITTAIKKIADEQFKIAKSSGLKSIEVHSTLSHPKSERWYKTLGFSSTGKTYTMNGHKVTIFERLL